MIRHMGNHSESWKNFPWKKFRRDLFRLQKRVYKAIQVGDNRKAKSLMKLILKSTAARLLAVRQVTQLNTGKKTAGVDGKASLSFEERFALSEELKQPIDTWKHKPLREIPIPKKDGKTRILKVPTIADRAWQCLVSEKKTKLTATTDGFDFLGWNFRVQKNGKFKSIPSADNFKTFRQKVKAIVNNSNYGATVKAKKLAPVVRGWRNYHRYCKMDGSRNSLVYIETKAFRVFNKEKKQSRESSKRLLDKAFPSIPYSENKHVMVRGKKSPFDGDIIYWSERNSKLYDGTTSQALNRQDHTCGHCGLKMLSDERVHLHHVDGNHNNWKKNNLLAIHESCHDYIHMSKRRKPRISGAVCGETRTYRSK